MPAALRFALAAWLWVGLAPFAAAEWLIYRETFGRPEAMSGNASTNLAGWADVLADGTFNTSLDTAHIPGVGGQPGDLKNIQAGPNIDGTTGAYAQGLHYSALGAGGLRLIWTSEFAFSTFPAFESVFRWRQGNASPADTVRAAVRMDEPSAPEGYVWYVHATAHATNSTSVAEFAANAELKQASLIHDAWGALLFNGDYDPATNAGTDSDFPLMAFTAATRLPRGNVTGFGLLLSSPAGTPRHALFDTFEVYISIPEPSSVALLAMAVCAFAARRRRCLGATFSPRSRLLKDATGG